MPLYEYRCEECQETFEKLVRAFREEVSCPACASGQVEKLISGFTLAGASRLVPSPGGGCGCGSGGCGCGRR
jgi:putative FmdB family regulatory protein